MTRNGLEAIPELAGVMLNSAMQAKRSNYLQVNAYERTEERKGCANGYKPKTVRTKLGDITFAIPQVREGGFYPSALEKGMRNERALVFVLAEMYVEGVSTRRVKASQKNCVGLRFQPCKSVGQPSNWMMSYRNGGNGPLEKLNTCMWMLVTSRSEQLVRYVMRLFWWLLGSLQRERQVLGISVSLSEHETLSRKGTLRSGKPFYKAYVIEVCMA